MSDAAWTVDRCNIRHSESKTSETARRDARVERGEVSETVDVNGPVVLGCMPSLSPLLHKPRSHASSNDEH
jgi:hypothetical protein